MAHDVKTEGYGRVCVYVCMCVCVSGEGWGGGSKSTSHAPLTPPPSLASIFMKPEHFSLVTSFDWS